MRGFVLLFVMVLAATAQTNPFQLAPIGCSKGHCTIAESDAIGIVPPVPMTGSSVCSTGPCIGDVNYYYTGGAGKSIGCTSSGSVVACKSESTNNLPHLEVFNGSATFSYSSCTTPSLTNCANSTPITDVCGTHGVIDRLDDSAGPALVGTDGTVIVADTHRIYRLNSNGTTDWATCLSAGGYSPTGTLLTTDSTGAVNVTLLTNNGPVMTFSSATGKPVSVGSGNVFKPDSGSDAGGTYYYTGNNSACASGNRIYAVMNKLHTDPASRVAADYQTGRLYALQISSAKPGITIAGRYDFLGPSQSSPMCSPAPDNGIFTDYGSTIPTSISGSGSGPQNGQDGVLAVTDCTSSVWNGKPPTYCNPNQDPHCPSGLQPCAFETRYLLNADPTLTGCNPSTTNCADYMDANYAWDPGNACLWARVHLYTSMWCLSTGASGNSLVPPGIVETIDVAALCTVLPGNPTAEHPASDMTISNTSYSNGKPTGDTIAIFGVIDSVKDHEAVIAIDTACTPPAHATVSAPCTGGQLYWYYMPMSYAAGQFAVSTDSFANPLVSFTDKSFGTYFIGDCGGANQQGCQTPKN